MEFRELTTDPEILAAFPLMSQLRDRIREDTFLAEVRREQAEGYRLCGGFEGDRLVALAGVRQTHTLARGEHLFVDDLVTLAEERGKGHGKALLAWLAARAGAEGIRRIHLDSRSTARGFYEKIGFTFSTSLPCSVDVNDPTLRPRKEESAGG
ncbi:MAG TPA: GNAT family N-acetyltransferase [Thermoanaerobaculia bacterium]|nr:GNAT family N-acetyltransferase [Thermoanaerobaculia bacterium]